MFGKFRNFGRMAIKQSRRISAKRGHPFYGNQHVNVSKYSRGKFSVSLAGGTKKQRLGVVAKLHDANFFSGIPNRRMAGTGRRLTLEAQGLAKKHGISIVNPLRPLKHKVRRVRSVKIFGVKRGIAGSIATKHFVGMGVAMVTPKVVRPVLSSGRMLSLLSRV